MAPVNSTRRKDEVHRQTLARDRFIGVLVDKTCPATTGIIAFELTALVDGLAHRLMLDTRPRTSSAAQRVRWP